MVAVVILAAGQSRRMNSNLSKVLHPLGGKCVIEHVIDVCNAINPKQIIPVLSPELKNHPLFTGYDVAVQDKALGTGHATKIALDSLKPDVQDVIIVCGDTPLIKTETLHKLKDQSDDVVLVGMELTPNELVMPYGRIIQNDAKAPTEIIEYNDANDQQRQISLANSAVYKISVPALKLLLPLIESNNKKGEFYLTDLVKLAHVKGYKTAVIHANHAEMLGINTRQDLAHAESILQNEWRAKMMNTGVTLVDPQTIYFSFDTKIGKDSRIGPFVTFGKGVELADNVTVLSFCHIEHTKAESYTTIGPFAHTRGNTILQEKSAIGNFVEVKGSTIGKKAKAKHLSYIGDATVGDKANIGAGTITCNYDGINKHKTTIGAGTMIGANTSLVAPVTIGNNALIGAGSTITKNVPEDALSLTRPDQIIKKDYRKKP